MTYYEDNKGAVGKQLTGAPAKAGVYHAKAELLLDEGKNSKDVVLDGQTYHLPLARGWTTYEIKARQQIRRSQTMKNRMVRSLEIQVQQEIREKIRNRQEKREQ